MASPANIRISAQFPFPALAVGAGGVTVTKKNGVYTIGSATLAALNVTFTPSGNITSIDVQDALAELDTKKAAISGLASVAFSGASPDLIGNIVPWTPILSCAAPGDLAVTYATRVGNIIQLSSRAYHVQYQIITSAFTWTTATGNVQIQGLPVATAAGIVSRGALQFGGITKAGYTNFNTGTGGGATNLNVTASGSGVATSNVTVADCPSGGTVSLTGDHVIFV